MRSPNWLALLALAPFLLFAAHRHCEFGADRLAVEATRDPQALIESIWKADAFEAKRRGKSPTPRQAVSRWDADDLVAPHPAPGRRQLAVERHWRAEVVRNRGTNQRPVNGGTQCLTAGTWRSAVEPVGAGAEVLRE